MGLECIQYRQGLIKPPQKEQEYNITTVASEQSSTVWAAVHAYQRLSHPFELAELLLIIRQYLNTYMPSSIFYSEILLLSYPLFCWVFLL